MIMFVVILIWCFGKHLEDRQIKFKPLHYKLGFLTIGTFIQLTTKVFPFVNCQIYSL